MHTPDIESAKTFYHTMFGWTYRDHTDHTITGHLTNGHHVIDITTPAPGDTTRPGWRHYIGVTDIDAALDLIRDLGGTAHPDPTPHRLGHAHAHDPLGSDFHLATITHPA